MVEAVLGPIGILLGLGAMFLLGFTVGRNQLRTEQSIERANNYLASTQEAPITRLVVQGQARAIAIKR